MIVGTSLAVQRLRLCASMTAHVRSLVGELRSHVMHGAAKNKIKLVVKPMAQSQGDASNAPSPLHRPYLLTGP